MLVTLAINLYSYIAINFKVKSKAALIIGLVLILSFSSVYAWSSKNTFATAKTKTVTIANLDGMIIPERQRIPREPIEINYGGICIETDNGLDYAHAGSLIYLPRVTDWCRTEVAGAMEQCRIMRIGNCLQYIPEECRPTGMSDRCINGTLLNEVYCWRGIIRQTRHRCTNFCSSNACY